MKCLFGYTLQPSFFDYACRIFICLAKAEQLTLKNCISRYTQLIQQFKLNCDDRDLDKECDRELLEQVWSLIARLEAAAKERDKNKAQNKVAHSKGKRTKGKSTPSPNTEVPAHTRGIIIRERAQAKGALTSGQATNQEVSSQVFGSNHESNQVPLVMTRKRSENSKRPRGSSINLALSSYEDDQ